MFKKYDIVLWDLDPKKGHTQSWTRPCVIVQSNSLNKYAPTFILVPLTSTIKKPFPSEFVIKPSSFNGLSHESRFLGSQIITLDKEFIAKKIWSLEEDYHEQVEQALDIVFDREKLFSKI